MPDMADQDDQNTGMQDDAGQIETGTQTTGADDATAVAGDHGGETALPDADDASAADADDASTPQTDADGTDDSEAQPS